MPSVWDDFFGPSIPEGGLPQQGQPLSPDEKIKLLGDYVNRRGDFADLEQPPEPATPAPATMPGRALPPNLSALGMPATSAPRLDMRAIAPPDAPPQGPQQPQQQSNAHLMTIQNGPESRVVAFDPNGAGGYSNTRAATTAEQARALPPVPTMTTPAQIAGYLNPSQTMPPDAATKLASVNLASSNAKDLIAAAEASHKMSQDRAVEQLTAQMVAAGLPPGQVQAAVANYKDLTSGSQSQQNTDVIMNQLLQHMGVAGKGAGAAAAGGAVRPAAVGPMKDLPYDVQDILKTSSSAGDFFIGAMRLNPDWARQNMPSLMRTAASKYGQDQVNNFLNRSYGRDVLDKIGSGFGLLAPTEASKAAAFVRDAKGNLVRQNMPAGY